MPEGLDRDQLKNVDQIKQPKAVASRSFSRSPPREKFDMKQFKQMQEKLDFEFELFKIDDEQT